VLAKRGQDVIVVARSERDLKATAADLALRFGVRTEAITLDIARPDLDVDALVQQCTKVAGRVDTVFIPAGAILETDIGACPDAVFPMAAVNYLGPAKIAAAFGREMARQGTGALVLFSSIAAAAPRRKNVAYSAAKAALEVYARGLRHELEPKGVRVAVLALGYVDTHLSFGMHLLFRVATPDEVASYAVGTGLRGRRYYPRFWWWITFILRHLPWTVYRRLSF
jgi:short-subunit dehydrogenase